ncbi:MAG: class I SAM-dependent methyltransferase [Gammaproteobacteria bacterium]|nr:class I SAM-dependent methyltransferase [Gammaproteobacteria bacterium]MBU1655981.1 class I SAM-dependent methyltransferase [Gammaproteobacteria bacterium]MBU1962565.1 class I SAM-dependent methyltransferase [Gammaproteobacteria bacterium]
MNSTAAYYQFERQEVAILLPSTYSRVLEIGCGAGRFRGNLSLEHEYWGVEPVKSEAMLASDSLDKVLIGTYDGVFNDIPDDYFDLVICNDVIEHLPDHDSFLQTIKRKMTKAGYLVASIPNVRHIENLFELLFRKDWKYQDAGILDRTHLRFFTRKSLKRTLLENGYTIESVVGLNPYKDRPSLRYFVRLLAILLLGLDTRFLQFGIRVVISPDPD